MYVCLLNILSRVCQLSGGTNIVCTCTQIKYNIETILRMLRTFTYGQLDLYIQATKLQESLSQALRFYFIAEK